MPLAGFQRDIVVRLERALSLSNWVVLRGRVGCGKRTVVGHSADSLGLSLHTVSLAGRLSEIRTTLLGHEDPDWPRPNDVGLLSSEDSCLMLTEIDEARPEVVELLIRLVRLSLRPESGRDPSSPLVVLVVKDILSPDQISRIQPLLRLIPVVDFPKAIPQGGIVEVIISIALNIDPDNGVRGNDFSFVGMPSDGFHLVKKWIVESITDNGCCTAEALRKAIARSMIYYLERLVYRGRPISVEDYTRWVNQFNPSCRAIADRILCVMVENNYVFDSCVFHDLLRQLVEKCGIPLGASGVAFCEWQAFIKSSSYITWQIKEHGSWGKRAFAIDLMGEPKDWKSAFGQKSTWAILADDFVGTGNTVSGIVPRIRQLLESCPNIRLRALFVAGFAEGVQVLKNLENEYGIERFSVSVGRLFYGIDTCFHPDSRVLGSPEERELLGGECDRLKGFGLGVHPRGYGGLGALVVMPSNVPNTTLPLLWFDQSKEWFALFPASVATYLSS